MNIFIIFVMSTFIRFYRFDISIILKIFCILIFLIIAFRKSFKIVTLIPFLGLFGHVHKFET
jgi:hypothetical protein